jgi:hypothetical protein
MGRFAGRLGPVLALLCGLVPAGCYDFHLQGPEDPPVDVVPRTVSVTIQYRQPSSCQNDSSRCDDPVVFYGSWMREGNEFSLTPDVNSHVFRGTALVVPVNYPPRDQPYFVRIYDPYLARTSSGGFTARRLVVGGESLTQVESSGSRQERALIFVDENGLGHNPF